MRTWIVAIAIVAGCKDGKDKGHDTAAVQNAATGNPAPKVTVPAVLAKDDRKPPFLYLVDAAGMVHLAAAKTWADLDANKLVVAKKSTKLDVVDRYVREEYGMGRDPAEGAAEWDKMSEDDLDLASLEDTSTRTGGAQDDPPPPPPEDDSDESGGTGTAMALDEGKMGKKDSDRAEGQYKMKKTDEDPQLARQQAIEQARAAGILGSRTVGGAFGRTPNEDGTPSRIAEVAGAVMTDGTLDRLRAMIVIPPTAKATTLITAVRETHAAIAVSYDGKLRPLHLDFDARDTANVPEASYWIEARVSAKGIVVEAVPDKPVDVTAIDQLGATITKLRGARGGEPESIDVLVDPDVDVQRLVDVVVALDVAGAKVIGMGPAPTAEELARRGHPIPRTAFGQPNAQGDLDKSAIRRVVKGAKQKITYCYEKALVAAPSLEGTVNAQFFITPNGTVASASASGVDPEVANCVAAVIKSLTFPKPKGSGGVQVNYPFTMRR